jgi:hypothetical protein
MDYMQKVIAMTIWGEEGRTVRLVPSFKVDGPEVEVVCPCSFKEKVNTFDDAKIHAVAPSLTTVKLYRYDHYSLPLTAYAGQCAKCKRYLWMAQTVKERMDEQRNGS